MVDLGRCEGGRVPTKAKDPYKDGKLTKKFHSELGKRRSRRVNPQDFKPLLKGEQRLHRPGGGEEPFRKDMYQVA